jgi:hypothetical protein
VPKTGCGVQFALYRYKSLKINILFATKTDVSGQKHIKNRLFRFCFRFLLNNPNRRKSEKTKSKKIERLRKGAEKPEIPQKVFCLELI